ncbi:hypothetical protein L202_07417 [Cryptococcus amylolentus CBS 6039]|uniref:TauD/TfdA-like domain-containing protein n=1 Tax=Cryptococcus amylolentus CBS 6039 TaxID=1295533 RepID=A0A1E3HC43_9TREE|nr:hypothetical protein L202_07417 [Cryptococcus amylolentus CBS 6039]ODN73907.1 hypothetical protein L202_07417 [Cryptococcus amylolentus CBS 6039]
MPPRIPLRPLTRAHSTSPFPHGSTAPQALTVPNLHLRKHPKRSPPPLPPTDASEEQQLLKPPPLNPISLSANPWAESYVVAEDDIEDSFIEGITVEDACSPSEGGRRKRHKRRPDEPIHEIKFSAHEKVVIYQNFVSFTSHGRSGVITHARLLDSCSCALCRDKSTRQKNTTTGESVRESKRVKFVKGHVSYGSVQVPALLASWIGPKGNRNDGQSHVSVFPMFRLRGMIESDNSSYTRSPTFVRQTWDGESLPLTNLRFKYSDLPQSLFKVLEQLQVYGIAIVEGVPTDTTGNDDCTLRKVTNMVGEIRNTFYGETWNVKSMKQSKNVAYTSVNLGLHMDLLYFSSPPRFQLLHCLRNRVEGGSSYFVDSFRAVNDLPKEKRRFLSSVTIPYQYDNDGHFLRYRHPIISPDYAPNSLHAAVNWSPPFRGPAEALDMPQDDIVAAAKQESKVFQAIADFEERLSDPRYRYEFTMQEGDLVLFDNRRVLHARTAFYDKDKESPEGVNEADKDDDESTEPTRWLKGCYLDGEVVWDKLATLRLESLRNTRNSQRRRRKSGGKKEAREEAAGGEKESEA